MTARPLLVAGTLALAAAAPLAFLPDPRPVAAALGLWVALTAAGLLSFYGPAHARTRRNRTPHTASDRAAAVALGLAAVGLVAGAALGVVGDARAVVVLPVAAVLPLVVGGALYVLPRQAKRPVSGAFAGVVVAATALGAAATPLAAETLGLPALLAVAVALLVLAGRAARAPGAQAKAAWPLFAAGALALAAVMPLTWLAYDAWAAAAAFLLGGEALLLAALTYALAPVVVNQVPYDRRWTRGIAPVALVGVAVLAWGLLGGPPLAAGKALLAGAALAHVANLAPMRRPRRECPPDLVAP